MNNTREELLHTRWKNIVMLAYDEPGAIRYGWQWFDRYCVYPWEHISDFVNCDKQIKEN